MGKKRFYVISYDIVEDRRRSRAAETLKDYGIRVQKSVFEARLDQPTVKKLLSRLHQLIDENTDTILVYLLCEACVSQKRLLGLKIWGAEGDFRLL
uniref:CRISPR-associated endoribonuclease Cas2 n=1 Tax=Desulfobacca acetoxidans TaxID=60893 RepID=A0A7V6A2N9_9BACT